jgi:hypothetical protein
MVTFRGLPSCRIRLIQSAGPLSAKYKPIRPYETDGLIKQKSKLIRYYGQRMLLCAVS